MNRQEADILNALILEPFTNQRILSEICNHSLGIVNRSIKSLISKGFLDSQIRPTKKARQEFKSKSPKNAIILAAGLGMRMVPINTQTPKALIEVNGEPLIERIIKQLHEVGIIEIYVVVGFMKEQFEYLIDKFNVELIVNEAYATKNNLHSLNLAAEHLSNTYIIPCDIWCSSNPFHKHELYSWYMVSDFIESRGSIRINRKMELVPVLEKQGGNSMIGISYLVEEDSSIIRERLDKMDKDSKYDDAFWEETLYDNKKMIVQANVACAADVIEINTYEQLRELDQSSNHLKADAISIIIQTLNVSLSEIKDITVLKKGMTNRSFIFSCKDKKYIMRIPGEGTDLLIDRNNEASVYKVISGIGICDNVIYINSDTGYKITEYFDGADACNPKDTKQLEACMNKLKNFHNLNLKVEHEFNIFKMIEFYEGLWNNTPSIYKDYKTTKEHVFSLKSYIDNHIQNKCLTHIDAVPDNFLFTKDGDIRLIDWEYAGMQDPHVDIAMFCIYSLYNKQEVNSLINMYFEDNCPKDVRIKIYCYIAACGLLWSNWCEYKRGLGVEFGEYSLRQYRYAKDYFKIVKEELTKNGDNK